MRRLKVKFLNADFNEVGEYMDNMKIYLKFVAMLPFFENRPQFRYRFLKKLYMFWIYFVCIYIFICSSVELVLNLHGSLLNITCNVTNTVVYATTTIILLYFHYFQKDFIDMMKKPDLLFKFRSAKGLTQLDMRASIVKCRRFCTIFSITGLVGALNWAVVPFLSKERELPLKIWYPFDVMQSPYYEMAFLTQIFGQVFATLLFSNLTIFYLSVGILVCGQFDLLCCSLRNLRFTALLEADHPINSLVMLCGYNYSGENRCTLPEDEDKIYFSGSVKILDPFLEKSFNNRLTKRDINEIFKLKFKVMKNTYNITSCLDDEHIMSSIDDCIRHHQIILEYCSDFKAFCSPLLLFKMFEITILACFTLYAFTMVAFMEYFILIMFDLFILCYFGNEVMLRSMNVGSALMCSPWYLLGNRHLKTLIPMIIRSMRPVQFNGGKFYMLTLENYISVLKASFSYFTVLRSIHESQNQA